MAARRRRVRLAFERERRQLARWRERLGWRRRRPAAHPPPPRSEGASASPGRPRSERFRPPPARRPGKARTEAVHARASLERNGTPVVRKRFGSAAGLLLSTILHAVLVVALLATRVPEPAGSDGAERTYRLTLRIVPPPRPAAEPAPPAEPELRAPVASEARDPVPAETPAPSAAPAETGADDGREAPLLAPPAAPGAEQPFAPVVGTGPSPPPLPGTRALGAGRGARGPLASRFDGRATSLLRYGGGQETEDAVDRGLRWLAAHQDEDGGWSADGFTRHCRAAGACGHRGLAEFDVGVSALATLAFLGAGHGPDTPRSLPASLASGAPASPYAEPVDRALDYLRARQSASGAFGAVGDHSNYNHAIATIAMAEAFGLTANDLYRESALAAIEHIARCQQARGGWDYLCDATGRNDLSISGWQIMALHVARTVGLTVPERTLRAAESYLAAAVTASGEGIYADRGIERGRRGVNMVATGLLSKLYLGSSSAERPLRRAVERVLAAPPSWNATRDWDRTFQSYYYWYTATLALFHVGGEAWEAWNYYLTRALLPLQEREGHEEGSWPAEASWVGISGGRVYATATAVLTLETYYRYPRLASVANER